MPLVSVNLDEVVEKPRLPAGQPFTFSVLSCELGIAKNENKNTHQREPLIKAVLTPMETGFDHVKVYQTWSLSPGALSSDDPTFSIKKFFLSIGRKWNSDGTFSTEDIATFRFIGTVKYEEGNNFPRLSSILSGA